MSDFEKPASESVDPTKQFGETPGEWSYNSSELKNVNARVIAKMLQLRNYSADPTEAAIIGDLAVVNGVLKSCTVAGTPGTWTAVGTTGGASTTIARDATSSSTCSGATSFPIAHTCTGTNRLLIVALEGHLISTDIVTSVTYNGFTMTRINGSINVGGESFWVYYLLNPSSGANNIVITTSADPAAGGGALYMVGVSYTGVLQSGFPESQYQDQNPSASNSAFHSSTGSPYEWGIVAWGGNKNPLSLGAATGNGSISTIVISNTYVAIADTNGTVNPPAALSADVRQASAGSMMKQEMNIEHA